MAERELERILQKLSRIEKMVEDLNTLNRNIERLTLNTEAMISGKRKR